MLGKINGNNAVKVGEVSNHPGFYTRPTLLDMEIYCSMLVHLTLKGLCSQLKLNEARNIPYADKARSEKEVIDYYTLPLLKRLEGIIEGLSPESSTIVRFCRPIIEKLSVLTRNSNVKITTDFQLENLKKKVWFLKKLKEKSNFASVQKAYRDKWSFYDLMNDRDFKQTYVNKAVDELGKSVSEGFKKSMDDYIKLVEEGEEVASKYFGGKASFQAYCKETKKANKVLNINLIHYDKSKPIKISDILQQEKDIGKLNIYCNEKRDICARRKDKKRCYEFKEGACYQMTSTWPVEDESGNISTCTMIMNVSSEGITEITSFSSGKGPNGGNYALSPEEHMELIERNEELYIQGSPLHEAVKKFLGMQQNREEMIRVEEGEECNSALSPGVVPVTNSSEDNSNPPALSSANSDAPTQTGVNLQGNGVQAETDLQQQKIDELVQGNRELRNKLNEVNSMIGGLMRNFENIKSDKSRHSIKLHNEVAELKESYGKFNEEMSHMQSKVRKIWHLLPKEERSYEYRIRGGRCYSIYSSSTELSSSEESEGYGSEVEVTRL